MKVLVIGGSGHVGTLVLPYLKQQHTLRVFDLRPPADATLDYQEGNLTDYAALSRAVEGMDAVLYMAMGSIRWTEVEGLHSAFDVNIKGVFLALDAAHKAGVPHAVYCSSMSVYDGVLETRYFFDEEMPPDARGLYGFTKRLGEEVGRNAWLLHGMTFNALRLCHPVSNAFWLEKVVAGTPSILTAEEDVARAMSAALSYRNGFQAFMISGDYENKILNMNKAKRLLGWEPLARPHAPADAL